MHIQVPSRQLDFVATSYTAHGEGGCRDGLIGMMLSGEKKEGM